MSSLDSLAISSYSFGGFITAFPLDYFPGLRTYSLSVFGCVEIYTDSPGRKINTVSMTMLLNVKKESPHENFGLTEEG